MSNAFSSMPNPFSGGCVHSHHTCAHLHGTQLQFEPLLTKIHAVLAELWFNHWTGLCEFNYCNSHTGSSLEKYHPTCVQDINWAHCRQDKEGFTTFKTNIWFIAGTKLSYLAMQSNNLLHQIMKIGWLEVVAMHTATTECIQHVPNWVRHCTYVVCTHSFVHQILCRRLRLNSTFRLHFELLLIIFGSANLEICIEYMYCNVWGLHTKICSASLLSSATHLQISWNRII